MMKRLKIKHIFMLLVICTVIFLVDYSGLLLHFHSKDYHKDFKYPLEDDIEPLMEQLRRGQEPSIAPINNHDYLIIKKARGKCLIDDDLHDKGIRLVYIVKSAMNHFKQRSIIRQTWGYEKRFSDVVIKTVFLLGSSDDNDLMQQIKDEYDEFQDIIQGDFIDSYYNNTLKTMMGLRWATEMCPHSKFYAFFDDDYYVSTRNMLRFLRNPVQYPAYLDQDIIHFDEMKKSNMRNLKQLIDFELPEDVKLYAGYVFHSRPQRHKFSKWYLTLEEYEFHLLPPYVTAGGYVLSKNALQDFYYGSYFVKRFRFDDVYMGLIAKKLTIEPFHCEEFHFYMKQPITAQNYRYVVASHGFSNPEVMERIWKKQKEFGNA